MRYQEARPKPLTKRQLFSSRFIIPKESSLVLEFENKEVYTHGTMEGMEYSYQKKSGNKSMVKIIAIVLIVVGIAVLAYMVFGGSGKKEAVVTPEPTATPFVFPTETPTPIPSVSPTATPSATPKIVETLDKKSGIDRAKVTVEVQNGSGVVGAASKIAEFLKGLGYNVTKIGNAPTFDFENVTIDSKKSTYTTLLKSDLMNSYTIASSSSTLSASSSADAVVIIGK